MINCFKVHYLKKQETEKKKAFLFSAFTLVEILVYLAIVSTILITIATFLSVIVQTQNKNIASHEVETQGTQIVQLITQSIRNSASINSPTLGTIDNTQLSINVDTVANNPTIFRLVSNKIEMQEGSATAIPLTSSKVTVSALEFYNLSPATTNEIIKFKFTVTYVNTGNKNEFKYSKIFYGSAARR